MMSKDKESFGQYLRRERILREIPLEEIARSTKIRLSTLVSLENDDFAHLPSIAFVRGFIRAYAEHLGLNVPEVMLRFTTFMDENYPELTTSPVAAGYTPHISRPLLLGFFAILIAGFFFYSYRYMKQPEVQTPVESPAGDTVETIPADTAPTPRDRQPQTPKIIKLEATELCWIQIILDDEPPREATLYPGDSVKYEAKERIRLLVGNAGGIKINYNDTSLENLGPSGMPIRLSFPAASGVPAPSGKK